MLKRECELGRVAWRMPCTVQSASRHEDGYRLQTSQGLLAARQLVLGRGGLAIPQLGANDFACAMARQFGLQLLDTRPARGPLTFDRWEGRRLVRGLVSKVK